MIYKFCFDLFSKIFLNKEIFKNKFHHQIVLTNVFNEWGGRSSIIRLILIGFLFMFHFVFRRPMFDLCFMCACFCCFCSACFPRELSSTTSGSWACLETARTYQLNQLSKWSMTTCLMELEGKISKWVSGSLTWVEFPCHLVLAHFIPWNRTN